MNSSLHRRSLIAVAVLGLTAPIVEARASSVAELFEQVPAPPADVATAMSWIKDGKVVAPQYTQLKLAIEAERAAIAALNGGVAPAPGAAPSSTTGEGPEVQTALKAYSDYLASNSGKQDPASVVGKRARWLHAAMTGKLATLLKAMKPCPSPCEDPGALAQNQPLEPQRSALAEQDLRQWNTLFLDWQAKRRDVVSQAQAQIAAAGGGAKAATAEGRAGVAGYRAAMLHEVEAALSVTELALKRVNAIETADVDAVSGSTYTPKGAKKS
jgi:hypothetical protein